MQGNGKYAMDKHKPPLQIKVMNREDIMDQKKHINDYKKYLNRYYGLQWIQPPLPKKPQLWLLGPPKQAIDRDDNLHQSIPCSIRDHLEEDSWLWPKQVIYFFSDLHADTDAFIASLVASGGIKKTGKKDKHFRLTREGKKAKFILGGDCFDKGPSTLRLLRMIKRLIDAKANIILLAGNHDMRTWIGMISLFHKTTPSSQHFFVRMGKKPLPLLKEIYSEYLETKKYKQDKIKKCKQYLYPSSQWESAFTVWAKKYMNEKAINKEIKRTKEKIADFEKWSKEADLTIPKVYAASKQWYKLFLHPKGEFFWFFKRLQLVHQEGSFLFVHAGVDDSSAKYIRNHGSKWINKCFKKLRTSQLSEFYYGSLGNMIRTKYRDTDKNFSKKGTLMLRNAGINVIVHGHQNRYYGQRMMLRKGMINFECDTSLDKHTRKAEGLSGFGAAVTIIRPQKLILGISSDYPYIKIFQPTLSFALCQ